MLNFIVGLIAGIVLGGILGAIISWLWGRSQTGAIRERLASTEHQVAELNEIRKEKEQLRIEVAELNKEREADNEKLKWLEVAEQKLRDSFQALASEALRSNNQEFRQLTQDQVVGLQNLITPLEKGLNNLDMQVRELEKTREGAYQGITKELALLHTTHAEFRTTTITLAQALKSSTVRGRWGELQLRRVVELAGMVEHIDFAEQSAGDGGRPDMLVFLPNNSILPVDAKTPMQAYFEAFETPDDNARQAKLTAHAKAIKERAMDLSRRQYWQQFQKTPEFVIMFIPNEACLHTAFEHEPDLLEYTLSRKVLIATPITLLALLKAVAHGWQQYQVTENSRQIASEGGELYKRLSRFISHLHDLGASLNKTVTTYNESIGSLETRLLPSARRFESLGISSDELKSPQPIMQAAKIPSFVLPVDAETTLSS